MRTKGMLIPLRRAYATATLLLAAGAAQALDVTGSLVTQDDKPFNGVIKWKASGRVYVITSGKVDLELPPAQVKELSIPEPAGYADAVKAVQEGRADQAIAALDRISQDYLMLKWDEPATRYLVQAYLAKGDSAGALRACDRVIASNPEAAFSGDMAPLDWQALLKSDKPAKLEDLIDQAIKTGVPDSTANALTMRGDMLSAKGDFKNALKDGYLRVVTLFRSVKAVQPEALFKAAKAFDQINQPSRAEMMRKQLLTEYGNSEWAAQIKGGK